MGLHYLQKARPDMLCAGGMNRESRMSVSGSGSADQFPGFRPARFTDHDSMWARTQGSPDQVIHRHVWRAAADFGAGHGVDNVAGVAFGVPIPTVQDDFVAIFHDEQADSPTG